MNKKKGNFSSKDHEVCEDESTKIVSKFLLSKKTVLGSILDKQDFFNDAISTILTSRQNRQNSYDILSEYIPSLISASSSSSSTKSSKENNLNSNLKKLYPVIDKFSSLLESVQQNEVDSYLNFIRVFVIETNYTSEIMTYWNKNINKIIQTIIRILKKFSTTSSFSILPDSYLFFTSIEVLTIFYKSKLRSIMTQFSKQIRDLLIPFFTTYIFKNENSMESNQFNAISELFTSISSTESSEIWALTIQWITSNMAIVLKELTTSSSISSIVKEIFTSKILEIPSTNSTNVANINRLKQSLSISAILEPLKGTDKAMAALTIYNQLAMTFNNLLVFGNSSGYVNLDISIFVSIMSSLLPISANVDINDPANFIENENNISKVDSSMVITEAKICTLHCLSTIFSLHSPLMIQFGQQLIQPVFSILNKVGVPCNECEYVPNLLIAALECVQSALPSIPSACSSILNMLKNGGGLLQLFTQQVAAVCFYRSGVSDLRLEKPDDLFHKYGLLKQSNELYIEHQNDEITKLILNTIELLMIHAGSMLNYSILLSVHDGIKLMLNTMSKGFTISPLPFDSKRMKRIQTERVRSSPTIILATFTLALSEILIYPNINKSSVSKAANSMTNIKGVHSDNIYLLQKVCRASSALPYTHPLIFNKISSISSFNYSHRDFIHNIVTESTRILHIIGQFINPIAYVVPPISIDIISKHFHNRLKDVGYVSSAVKAAEGIKRVSSMTETKLEINESQESKKSKIDSEEKVKVDIKIDNDLNLLNNSSGLKPLNFTEPPKISHIDASKSITTGKKPEGEEEDDELPDIDMGSESE